jgi:hypothetical protein
VEKFDRLSQRLCSFLADKRPTRKARTWRQSDNGDNKNTDATILHHRSSKLSKYISKPYRRLRQLLIGKFLQKSLVGSGLPRWGLVAPAEILMFNTRYVCTIRYWP